MDNSTDKILEEINSSIKKLASNQRQEWRQVMLTQYNIFGTIASLEVATLAIYIGVSSQLFLSEKIIFSLTTLFLFTEVLVILWLINQERKVAYGDKMDCFKEKESFYRSALILIMIITFGLIITLLVIRIWKLQ